MDYQKTTNVMRDGWLVPSKRWYQSVEAKLAQAGEQGWRVASAEESRDRFLVNTDTGNTVSVPFDSPALEVAQDRLEGTGHGIFRFASDEETRQYWTDRKAQEEAYEQKQTQRAADAAAKRSRAGGVS